MKVYEMAAELVHGVGGFEDWERYEMVLFAHGDRDAALADFVIRSIANTRSVTGSALFAAIAERRASTEAVTA